MDIKELLYIKKKQLQDYNNIIRFSDYVKTIVSSGVEMFKHNIPAVFNYNEKELEKNLLMYGSVMFLKKDGKYSIFPCTVGGEVGEDNRPTKAFPIIRNKQGQYARKSRGYIIGSECVVMYNNSMLSPELSITRYADILADIDISYKYLVESSKYYPIPIAEDDKQATIINKAMKDMSVGKKKSIVVGSSLEELVNSMGTNTNKKTIDTLNLTDPSKIQYAQALGMLHNDIISRLYTVNGQAMNGSPKMAQQTKEEVTANHTNSMIYPNNKLSERQLACEKINELWSLDYSVDFGELWLYSVKANEDAGNNIALEGGVDSE